jgi:Mor family transcriptional regulator
MNERIILENIVTNGIAPHKVLRDFDIVHDRKKGIGIQQLSDRYNLSCRQITNILRRAK